MRRVWPWALTAFAVLLAALGAAESTGSVFVALSGGFVATQLITPSWLDRWRRRSRDVASARPVAVGSGRTARAAVAWVRLPGRPRRTPALAVGVPGLAAGVPGLAAGVPAPAARWVTIDVKARLRSADRPTRQLPLPAA